MKIWKALTETIMGKPPKIYPKSIADKLGSKLDALAQTPKGLQVKELVLQLHPKIEAAQASGYTLEDIVKEFESAGVSLTLNTLKQYLREARATPDLHPSSNPKSSSNKKPQASLTSSSTEEAASADGRTTKPRLTNTNEEGFQRMLSNDEL
jgi:hypothetical protein